MHKTGPRNISIANLMHYRFPVMAIASIFHRLSGFILFLMIPFILWILDASLKSSASFNQLHQCLSYPVSKFFVWVLLSALAYHVIAGIKHLIMDLGHLESKVGGKISSTIVMLLAFVVIIALGVWLW